MSHLYRRTDSNWIGNKQGDQSETYWRKQVRAAFEKHPQVEIVEVVPTGNKLDSLFLSRGCDSSPTGVVVILTSTGGKWGKSRRDYSPATI